MPTLSVNIDHVASLREARKTVEPDPLIAGLIVQSCGVAGVTVHLRKDRRHIQEKDLRSLRKTLDIKINLEMAVSREMLRIAGEVRPELVTLVPEMSGEVTTRGGLDVRKNKKRLIPFIRSLKEKGITVSIFVDPEKAQIQAAKEAGANFVEIHTGIYAEKFLQKKNFKAELKRIQKAIEFARTLGLKVNAGHGLTSKNVQAISSIKGIEELSIGHSIISQAVLKGLAPAVKEILKQIMP